MGGGLGGWLATNERILRGARRLVAPSHDTAARYARDPPHRAVAADVGRRLLAVEVAPVDQVDLRAVPLEVGGWLATNERILRGARRLVAPSHDTAARYARRLGSRA
jgi:hypothetical protein